MPEPGDVVLMVVPMLGGGTKPRPALVLSALPGPFQRVLVCGFSTDRLSVVTPDWDVLVDPADSEFSATGLKRPSVLRLSFLYAAHESEIGGTIGSFPAAEFALLRSRLVRLFV